MSLPVSDLLVFVEDNPRMIELAIFALGTLFGNKLAIGRDKRKEFNQLSESSLAALTRQIESIEHGNPGQGLGDLMLLESYMPFYKRGLFRMHVKKYREALNCIGSYDENTATVSFDTEKLSILGRRAKNLRSYLHRR